jgi:hypothetical protein
MHLICMHLIWMHLIWMQLTWARWSARTWPGGRGGAGGAWLPRIKAGPR